MIEVRMPVYRITEKAEDGSVLKTEYLEDRWVRLHEAIVGSPVGEGGNVRLGTPDAWETRKV